MSSRRSARLFLLFLLPLFASARPLPFPLFPGFVSALPTATVAVPRGLAIPLTIHTVADSNLTVGAQKFFRVTEDVVLHNVLLFGAGAVACGRIAGLEKDAQGRLLAIDLVLERVQATDGSQVGLCPTVVHIRTVAAYAPGGQVRVDAMVQGLVRGDIVLGW